MLNILIWRIFSSDLIFQFSTIFFFNTLKHLYFNNLYCSILSIIVAIFFMHPIFFLIFDHKNVSMSSTIFSIHELLILILISGLFLILRHKKRKFRTLRKYFFRQTSPFYRFKTLFLNVLAFWKKNLYLTIIKNLVKFLLFPA